MMVVSSCIRQQHLPVQFQELGEPSGFPINVRLDLSSRWKQSRVQLCFDDLRSVSDSANQRNICRHRAAFTAGTNPAPGADPERMGVFAAVIDPACETESLWK